MDGVLSRAISLGVRSGLTPAQVRRVQTINLVTLGSVFLNLVYIGIILVVDVVAFIVPLLTNSIAVLLNLAVLRANAAFHTDAAMWMSFGTAFFNLVLASYFFGIGTGVYLFLLVIPAVSVLVTPPGSLKLSVAFSAVGLAAFAGIALAEPPTPAPIAGSSLEAVLFLTSVLGTVAFIAGVSIYHRRVAEVAEEEVHAAHRHSERLLHNILPVEIADRLKSNGGVIADRMDDVSVLFADLVGSTPLSERLTADQMVEFLNDIFCPFDDLADALGLEKIKTVGDAYMVVGGLPVWKDGHLSSMAEMALRMRDEVRRHPVEGLGAVQMRFGIHVGPVVAGVIGKRKFSYDLWGDTVNTAARMESHGVPNEIHVTETVFQRLGGAYRFEQRGLVDIKGKGLMPTYFLVGPV
ncbi:MAG TPA: adenylate/guanylate cyclase domain-containing protein [Acidimicrobiia bacterium]|nr:adenylate/guanylate cyclase domain-containing protein [Acidimicrobiia bacterium]